MYTCFKLKDYYMILMYMELMLRKLVSTLLYPTELMDGAIVSGNCVSACDKNTSYASFEQPS